MFKRSIIFLLIVALISSMIFTHNYSQKEVKAASNDVTSFTRQKINFNREWKFVRDDPENANMENYNDSSWYNVGLPHDFSIPYWQEEKHYTGYGWYRKTFEVKKEWAGKHITLDFAGVFHTAEVYINGEYAGYHEGGYTGFEIDITDLVRTGENVVAIRVNNIWKATLAPRAGEHMFTGGIYRDVNLIVSSPVHVAWYGTFVQTPDISADKSNVRVLTEVANDSSQAQNVAVSHTIKDAAGNVVATIDSKATSIAPGTAYEFDNSSGYINNPKLWSPETPNMYMVHTEVTVNGSSVVDQYDTPFGFRWVEFSPDEGFFLNGEHYWIDGANAHQDHAGWANAVTTDALYRDVAMIKESGLNFIRGSHYPHSPAFADACDKLGMLFWSEAAFWCTSAWGEGGNAGNSDDYKADGYPTTGNKETEEAFEQSCIDCLSEMIRINRNHPSIIVWCMGNEPFFGDNPEKKKALISRMAGTAKELDPTRHTAIGGTQRGSFDHLPNVDIAGYNGDGASMPEYQNPGVGNLVSEYSTHTGNRPEEFKCYYGSVQTDENGEPIRYPWRSGVSLWCAFHHGSILSRSYGDMGYVDYYRLPLNIWYYYRYNRTGVEPEFSQEGTPAKLTLSASDTTIKNDGTSDSHIIVTVTDDEGNWLNNTPEVTLEITDGPGIFPTGKSITFKPGDSMRDGKAAIEFRSYYAGVTTIEAYSATNPELEPAVINITTTGEGSTDEPAIETMYGVFMSNGGYVLNSVEEPVPYKYHKFEGCPMNASSGMNSAPYIQDGNTITSWVADTPGKDQWVYLEIEHGGINLYKAQLLFDKKMYPYTIQYKTNNASDDEWITLREYTADTIASRPEEESFDGTYMRYIRILFKDVPEGEYANLAELKLFGIRADTTGYSIGYESLADIPVDGSASTTDSVNTDNSGNILGSTNYELVYNLEKYAEDTGGRYGRFQTGISIDENASISSPVTFAIYCDDELMFEKKVSDVSDVSMVDISINKVKTLKITAASDQENIPFSLINPRLMGVYRDISLYNSMAQTNLVTQICADSLTLIPGREFTYQSRVTNKADSRRELCLATLLYKADGTLFDTSMEYISIPSKGTLVKDLSMPVPKNLGRGGKAVIIAWDRASLLPVTEAMLVINETASDGNEPSVTSERFSLLQTMNEAIAFIMTATADKYTAESKTGFTDALFAADTLLKNESASSADYAAAEGNIKASIQKLALIQLNAPDNTPDNTNSGNTQPPATVPTTKSFKLSKGKVYRAGKYRYKVLKINKKTANVSLYKPVSGKLTRVVVPATVKIKGINCKVTAIAGKAFINNKKLKKVVVGKNVTTIGKKAFYNTAKLKTVIIKSTKLKSVAKNSFGKTNKKLSIKVPSKKKKAYKKLFK